MLQDRVTATPCTEELFLSTHYISSPCISDDQPCGREDMDGQHDTFGGSGWVSHLPAGPHHRLQSLRQNWIFLYNYFVTGEDDKAIYSFPGDTLIPIDLKKSIILR
jgi:hypothetical protein